MWNRACPLCSARVPRSLVLTRTDDLLCPSCHAPLELSRPSRVIGALVGLLAAYAVCHLILLEAARGRWFTSMIGALLGYAAGSALVLFLFSDVVVRPKPAHENHPQIHT
jgi:hypothetical protein